LAVAVDLEKSTMWIEWISTHEGDRLDVLAPLTDAYEGRHYPIDPPDPIETIKFRIEQQGLTRRTWRKSSAHAPA
jgi:HTH-type transcriptional regulator / antitoxin HigA